MNEIKMNILPIQIYSVVGAKPTQAKKNRCLVWTKCGMKVGEGEMKDKKTKTEPKKEKIDLLYASPVQNPFEKKSK